MTNAPISAYAPYPTIEQLLAGKSPAELRAIAEAAATAETAKAAYYAAYEELRTRKLPNAIPGAWRSLPIAGQNGVPLSAATPTYDADGQPQKRQAITQDEAEFLAHAERLFGKAQAAVVAYNHLLEAPPAKA